MKRKFCEISENCSKSELQITEVPPTQVAIETGIWDTIYPEEGSLANNVIEFKITGDSLNYLDLANINYFAEVEIKPNGKSVDANDSLLIDGKPIFPVNNFLHSLIESVTVRFNDEIVEQTSEYAYKAYFEDLLNFDSEQKSTYLEQQCFYKDVAGQFDNFSLISRPQQYDTFFSLPEQCYWGKSGNVPEFFYGATPPTGPDEAAVKEKMRLIKIISSAQAIEKNEGACKRREYIKNVKLMKGKLHLDTFNLNKLMIPGVTVKISLKKNQLNHCLMYNSEDDLCKIDYKRAYLKVRRNIVASSEMLAQQLAMEKMPAIFPYKKNIVKTLNCSYNSALINVVIHEGELPNKVLLAFIDTTAKAGHYKQNPFKFQHYNMTKIDLKVNSKNVVFTDGLSMKLDKQMDVLEAYDTLYSCLSPCSKDLTILDYVKGNFIVAFDLTPDLFSGEHFNNLINGRLEVSLKFATDITKSIVLIAYLEFDNVISISNTKKVTCSYQ